MSTMDKIEQALDGLLRAAIDDDLVWAKQGAFVPRDVDLTAPFPSAAGREVDALVDQPVGSACRQAIRRLGQRLFEETKSVDAMREVLECAADREPQRFGRRMAIVDAAWNGIGEGAEIWVA